jgi:prepilin-type N-terminal cleavage/methylation domain-containing protein
MGEVMNAPSERGFSLMEVLVAMVILSVGLLGLAQTFYSGMAIMMSAPATLVAREKAREAIESVHAARDTVVLDWAEIRNVTAPAGCPAGTTANGGGVFLVGAQTLRRPGTDGLVNTADDTSASLEASPGPDNLMGTADDIPLTGFTRQVDICDVNGNTALRMIIVTIGYRAAGGVGQSQRQVVLRTLISSFS